MKDYLYTIVELKDKQGHYVVVDTFAQQTRYENNDMLITVSLDSLEEVHVNSNELIKEVLEADLGHTELKQLSKVKAYQKNKLNNFLDKQKHYLRGLSLWEG